MTESEHNEILPKCQEKFSDILLALTETRKDVQHIKGRIDNGMSKTLTEICNAFIELKPKIEHHAGVIRRIEDFGWWISKTVGLAILVSIIGITIWAISNGWNTNL